MSSQNTNTVLMIRPVHFRMNEQTIVNNYYQQQSAQLLDDSKALIEFEAMVQGLRAEGISVIEYEPKDELDTPDEVFPNNWISLHEPNLVVTYPLFAENRRLERRFDVIDFVKKQGFNFDNHIDLTFLEERGLFLEGTGSLVLDRVDRIAFANISERMHIEALSLWCEKMNYRPIVFEAFHNVGEKRLRVYHTNVVMSIGSEWAVCCLDSIDNAESREKVRSELEKKRDLIAISEQAMAHFAGNILEVQNNLGEKCIIMSQSAYNALGIEIINRLCRYAKPLIYDLSYIESQGGGSARCMLAEVFVNSQTS